jgi:DNA-binding CsgD family transcriptional regulator
MTSQKSLNAELEQTDITHPAANEGVLVVDLGFELVAYDRGARAIMNGSTGSINGEAHLPAEIRELLGARPSAELASLIFHLNIGDQNYSCRTFLVEPLDDNGHEMVLALYLKKAESLGDALNEVAEDYHLTEREREVLGGIALGLTTKALAKRLNISPNTVNAFLRLVMIKMGATTRAGVVGKVLEQNGATANKDRRALRTGGSHV